MTKPRHIYFFAPEEPSPTGGINMIFRFAELLRASGHSVSVHFESPDFVYRFQDSTVETTYSTHRTPPGIGLRSIRSTLADWQKNQNKSREPGANRLSVPGPEDLIIVPEFWYNNQQHRIETIPHVILVQAFEPAVLPSFLKYGSREDVSVSLRGFITTSKICGALIGDLTDAPHVTVPLYIDSDEFTFAETKKRQLAFMPRRRNAEAMLLVEMLRSRSELQDYGIVAIDNMTPEVVRRVLSETLIFLSFSQREGFGLPPAEAMAMGCIVVGYTGVGGQEFFTPDIAYPIPEDDFPAYFRTVLHVMRAYDADPRKIDTMRRAASERILSTYTRDATVGALLEAIERFSR